MSQELRKYLASLLMLFILVGLIVVLFVYTVPSPNRDVILLLLGSVTTAAMAAIPNLFGDRDQEKAALIAQVAQMTEKIKILEAKAETIGLAYERLMNMLVQRHVVDGEGLRLEPEERNVL